MKKFLVASLIGLTVLGAQAHGYEHHGYRGGYGWGWVAPAVIGGAVVYAATRPPVVVQQPPVVVQQPTYQIPAGYHWESVLDANCNCYRNVLVPN
jgi:hypothetical protein